MTEVRLGSRYALVIHASNLLDHTRVKSFGVVIHQSHIVLSLVNAILPQDLSNTTQLTRFIIQCSAAIR